MGKNVRGTTGGRLLTVPERHWACAPCGRTSVTREAQPHSQLHPCPAVGGLLAPYALVPPGRDAESVKAALTAHLREDHEAHRARVGGPETLARDERGRPYTRVSLAYDDASSPTGVTQHHAIYVPGININLTGGGA